MYAIIDNFLESYPTLKAHSFACKFEDIQNPVDGVIYPLICRDIPEVVQSEIYARLSAAQGREIENPTIFMRMSTEGVSVPHIAHNDISMGKHSLMLYLNDGVGGTSFLRHKETGMCYQPELQVLRNIARHDYSQDLIRIAERDQNDVDAWEVMLTAPMAQNRAFVFDAGYFHRAEPIGGFGSTQQDARIVLTVFFS